MPLYEIHYRRWYNTPKDYTKISHFGIITLEQAKGLREVQGDLVVHYWSGEIVKSQDWLFDCEKKDSNCYAQKAIRFGK